MTAPPRWLVVLLLLAGCPARTEPDTKGGPATASISTPEPISAPASDPPPRTFTISAVGDCTLGGGFENGAIATAFDHMIEDHGGDLSVPFSSVAHIFKNDDLTIANLEGTLTTSTQPIPQGKFHFRGKPEYGKILVLGSVEVVNLANNHIGDFGPRGYEDTLKALREAGVGAFGNGLVDRREVRGVEVENLGFVGLYATDANVKRDVAAHKTKVNIVIASFHWGLEGTHEVIDLQRRLGRLAIDAGADLVLGHHPHVVQAIETYQGRHIVHSLGNFVFGANTNPQEAESMIYRATFREIDGRFAFSSSEVIPVRTCPTTPCTEFRPVLLEGKAREDFLVRMNDENERLAKKPLGKRVTSRP